MLETFIEWLEKHKKIQIVFIVIITFLPLLYFADTNTDWTDFISKPKRLLYLIFCWVFVAVAYASTKIDTHGEKPVPIISCIFVIGLTTFIGFNTYHGINVSSGDDDYDYVDPYANDPRILYNQKLKIYGTVLKTFKLTEKTSTKYVNLKSRLNE